MRVVTFDKSLSLTIRDDYIDFPLDIKNNAMKLLEKNYLHKNFMNAYITDIEILRMNDFLVIPNTSIDDYATLSVYVRFTGSTILVGDILPDCVFVQSINKSMIRFTYKGIIQGHLIINKDALLPELKPGESVFIVEVVKVMCQTFKSVISIQAKLFELYKPIPCIGCQEMNNINFDDYNDLWKYVSMGFDGVPIEHVEEGAKLVYCRGRFYETLDEYMDIKDSKYIIENINHNFNILFNIGKQKLENYYISYIE